MKNWMPVRREGPLKGIGGRCAPKRHRLFRWGRETWAPSWGEAASESLRAMLDYAVPKLYPKLEMGTRPIKGTEADEILKAANLNGLSKVFYQGSDGLGLVMMEGTKYVVNVQAPIAKEVMGYLNQEHDYGNKVTGRMLEDHFGGLGYGWEREILWIVLASLLRAGVIEVTYQGRRFRNHLDAQVRAVFAGTNAFRSASFAPRKAPDLKTLVSAARRYEELTGEEVDVDEADHRSGLPKPGAQRVERFAACRGHRQSQPGAGAGGFERIPQYLDDHHSRRVG